MRTEFILVIYWAFYLLNVYVPTWIAESYEQQNLEYESGIDSID